MSRKGFTLIEVLIVVVIMAILAATIIPQFTDASGDAEIATTEFNLNTLRAQIELYKAQHGGTPPALDAVNNTIAELLTQTTHKGQTYGPYMTSIPQNTVTKLATVAAGTSPITTATAGGGGWLYDENTGEVRIDHDDHIGK